MKRCLKTSIHVQLSVQQWRQRPRTTTVHVLGKKLGFQPLASVVKSHCAVIFSKGFLSVTFLCLYMYVSFTFYTTFLSFKGRKDPLKRSNFAEKMLMVLNQVSKHLYGYKLGQPAFTPVVDFKTVLEQYTHDALFD